VTPIGSNRVRHENMLSHVSWVTGHNAEHCAGVNLSAASDDAGVGAIGVGSSRTGGGGGGSSRTGGGGGGGIIDCIAEGPACICCGFTGVA
jgi:hypothetical protein